MTYALLYLDNRFISVSRYYSFNFFLHLIVVLLQFFVFLFIVCFSQWLEISAIVFHQLLFQINHRNCVSTNNIWWCLLINLAAAVPNVVAVFSTLWTVRVQPQSSAQKPRKQRENGTSVVYLLIFEFSGLCPTTSISTLKIPFNCHDPPVCRLCAASSIVWWLTVITWLVKLNLKRIRRRTKIWLKAHSSEYNNEIRLMPLRLWYAVCREQTYTARHSVHLT